MLYPSCRGSARRKVRAVIATGGRPTAPPIPGLDEVAPLVAQRRRRARHAHGWRRATGRRRASPEYVDSRPSQSRRRIVLCDRCAALTHPSHHGGEIHGGRARSDTERRGVRQLADGSCGANDRLRRHAARRRAAPRRGRDRGGEGGRGRPSATRAPRPSHETRVGLPSSWMMRGEPNRFVNVTVGSALNSGVHSKRHAGASCALA